MTGQWTGLSGLNDIKTYHHAATGDIGSDGVNRSLNTFSEEMFTFHSPETQFERVYLNARELRLYPCKAGFAKLKGDRRSITRLVRETRVIELIAHLVNCSK